MNSGLKKQLAVSAVVILAFGLGVFAGKAWEQVRGTFHDIIVNHPEDLQALVTPDDERVEKLAVELQTPEKAYEYVRDRIAYEPSQPLMPAGNVIDLGKASCVGKAVLLCSLYRAMGFPASDVRVATGELAHPGAAIYHAWVDMEYEGNCYQQDTTNLIGTFDFHEFKGTRFTRSFVRREEFIFNDEDFSVVSPLNMIKDAHSSAP